MSVSGLALNSYIVGRQRAEIYFGRNMDGIQSWSAFEQRQRQRNSDLPRRDASSDADPDNVVPGIDALWVSSSSPDIAPAAASLLRHSGLTAIIDKSKQAAGVRRDENSQIRYTTDVEEFRLRFHWMRPHPSLAYASEEILLTSGAEAGIADGNKALEAGRGNHARGEYSSSMIMSDPAIESARLMEAYRSSQMTKTQVDVATGDEDHDGDEIKNQKRDKSSKDTDRRPGGFPLEFPILRINLASLMEPPLMTSWLPGEDYGISCDSDVEEGDTSD
jgi:hypothetical protein